MLFTRAKADICRKARPWRRGGVPRGIRENAKIINGNYIDGFPAA
jgi:hypothetical protein